MYSLCYIVDILLQSVPLPSINSLRLLDFTFDDEAVGSIEPDGIHLGSITCHRIIKAIDIQIKRFFKSFSIEFLFS